MSSIYGNGEPILTKRQVAIDEVKAFVHAKMEENYNDASLWSEFRSIESALGRIR